MAVAEELVVSVRDRVGTRAARRERSHGRVPGVMYGHDKPPVHVTAGADALDAVVRHGARIVDVKLNGETEKALVRDLQWDVFGAKVLHFDLERVSLAERLTVDVPIELRGTAPGAAKGGLLEHVMHSIEVECLPTEIPDAIRVNVSNMNIGDVIHVKELSLPPGVRALADADAWVVRVAEPREELPPEVEAPSAAEPEVIRREEKKEEEGEE